jgi:mono/diheme cytochrome c family protein
MKALVLFFAALTTLVASASPPRAQDFGAIERGKYLFAAAGCASCHTDFKNNGPLLGGGRALATPFGTFYGPNITADKEHGIGGWTDAEFIQALRMGLSPKGEHYYPVFPYPSFTYMTDGDMRDLKAYIFSLPTSDRPSKPHDIKFPFNYRISMIGWNLLFLDPGPFKADDSRDEAWNRGAYLVRAVGHCGECHTERNFLGAKRVDRELGGSPVGPDGDSVPNITPDEKSGIGAWSEEEIADLLQSGMTPDGDSVSRSMDEVVQNLSKLTDDDRHAIAAYLKALPPVRTELKAPKKD